MPKSNSKINTKSYQKLGNNIVILIRKGCCGAHTAEDDNEEAYEEISNNIGILTRKGCCGAHNAEDEYSNEAYKIIIEECAKEASSYELSNKYFDPNNTDSTNDNIIITSVISIANPITLIPPRKQ